MLEDQISRSSLMRSSHTYDAYDIYVMYDGKMLIKDHLISNLDESI